MPIVFILHGILASDLVGVSPFALRVKYYWNVPGVLAGALSYLRLNADGVTPFYPSTLPIQPGVLEPSSLNDLEDRLQLLGWKTYQIPYDWRLDLQASAAAVYAQIKAIAAGQPYYLACHSMGGIVARLIYRLAVADGTAGQLQRIVTLGTPHWGSYSTVRNLAHQGLDYAITSAANALPGLSFTTVQQLIGNGNAFGDTDSILSSWPTFYQLFPNLAEPNPPPDPSRAQLYQASTLSGINTFVQQPWLNAGQQLGALLADPSSQPPDALMVCVRGRGTKTAAAWNSTQPLNGVGAYAYADGDGYVTANSAVMRRQVIDVVAGHSDLPNNPAVLDWISPWLQLGRPAGPDVQQLPGLGRDPTDSPNGTPRFFIPWVDGDNPSAAPVFMEAPPFCPAGPGANLAPGLAPGR